MKNTLKLLCVLALFLGLAHNAAAQDSAPEIEADSYAPNTAGLHLGTAHSTSGFNNTNPGVYLRWADASGTGPVLGTYYNSERAQSVYAAYAWSWRTSGASGQANTGSLSAAITAGAITGYQSGRIMPLLVPSVALHHGHAALRLTYVPKVEKRSAHALHASTEWQF